MTVGTKQKLAFQNEELCLTMLQFEILKGGSFIYKINNNGPSIEP
jgi:hypothetical protein